MSNIVRLDSKRAKRVKKITQNLERVHVHQAMKRLIEEVAFESYRLMAAGSILGRKAPHDVAMAFSEFVTDSLKAGFADLEEQMYGN